MKLQTQLLTALLLQSVQYSFAQSVLVNSFEKFQPEKNTSIRAIEVLNDSTLWFAGSNGYFGFTENGGSTWTIDSLRIDSFIPEFRSLALLNDHTALLMNTGSPAYIWKSDDIGVTWKTVYENEDDDIFFDALRFSDEVNGIAAGDPIRDCFQILITHDGGDSWTPVSCADIPTALGGESCFASSNTSVDVAGKFAWLGTGALHSRVANSIDGGAHWKVAEAPIIEGGELTGIFSLDFYDFTNGIISGGDYNDKSSNTLTVALTHDGGKTWKALDEEDALPFVSCIQYRPNSKGSVILATCLPGIYYSTDGGLHWANLKNTLGSERGKGFTESFFTLRFSPSGNVVWLAGDNGRIARMELR